MSEGQQSKSAGKELALAQPRASRVRGAGFDRLTDRERDVLQLIADQLVISVKTVEAHIMSKLGARNRTDLIRYAIRRGIIGLDPMPRLRAG